MINIKNNAKKMADLLRSGYTMLNLACPACNNPLFRYKNTGMFCPICNKKVIIQKKEQLHSSSHTVKKEDKDEIKYLKKDLKVIINSNSLKEILEEKIEFISCKLNGETQIDLIERYIKILTEIYDLLGKIPIDNASAGI